MSMMLAAAKHLSRGDGDPPEPRRPLAGAIAWAVAIIATIVAFFILGFAGHWLIAVLVAPSLLIIGIFIGLAIAV